MGAESEGQRHSGSNDSHTRLIKSLRDAFGGASPAAYADQFFVRESIRSHAMAFVAARKPLSGCCIQTRCSRLPVVVSAGDAAAVDR